MQQELKDRSHISFWELDPNVKIMNPDSSPGAPTEPIKKAYHTYLDTEAPPKMRKTGRQLIRHMMCIRRFPHKL